MSQSYRIAILGATGAVGTELMSLLAERQFPVADLTLLASERSSGTSLQFKGEEIPVTAVSEDSFRGMDFVLASAGGSTSRQWAKTIVAAGAVMIDNSSAFRMDADVPLVIPEINPKAATQHQGIIANPNCSTILMNMAVWPLHQVSPVQRIIVSTYQSVSGAGARAIEELKRQSQAVLQGQIPQAEILPYPIAFNLFPHNSALNDQGYCEEEMKMVKETHKIFGSPQIRITATCVRVPVFRAHSEAVNIEFQAPFPVEKARSILAATPGLKLVDDWQNNYFPMPLEASGKDEVLVGRIRQDISNPESLDLWLSGDQIRKGAALNAVQIAELFVKS